MKNFNSIFAAAAILALIGTTGGANATLVDQGLTTLDTDTGLEWLDVTLTDNRSYDNIVVDGFGGYAAAGYVHATRSQLCGLMGALGDSLANCSTGGDTDDPLSPASSLQLVTLLGINFSDNGAISTRGWFDDGNNTVGIGCIDHQIRTCVPTPINITSRAQISGSNGTPTSTSFVGIGNFLVRAAQVPEPGAIALLSVGLLGVYAVRRMKAG